MEFLAWESFEAAMVVARRVSDDWNLTGDLGAMEGI